MFSWGVKQTGSSVGKSHRDTKETKEYETPLDRLAFFRIDTSKSKVHVTRRQSPPASVQGDSDNESENSVSSGSEVKLNTIITRAGRYRTAFI